MSDYVDGNFDSDYYSEKYFASDEGINYKDSDGVTHAWGYRNKQGEWSGCAPIVAAWKELFNPSNMLDIGCGRGTFITYAQDIGIDAVGFDFSEWAIDHPYFRCNREWLKVHDARETFPYQDNQFDLVISLDLMEHIYAQDIKKVMDEIIRVSKKYIFLQIAVTRVNPGQSVNDVGYVLEKGQPVPNELQGTAVAGHVTVQPSVFWISELSKLGWVSRDDLVKRFIELVPEDVINNWVANLLLIMEKVD